MSSIRKLTSGLHCPTTRCLEKGDVQSVLRKVVFDVFIEGMLIDDLWRDLLLCPFTSNVTNNNPIIMVTPTRVIKSFFIFTLLKRFIFTRMVFSDYTMWDTTLNDVLYETFIAEKKMKCTYYQSKCLNEILFLRISFIRMNYNFEC